MESEKISKKIQGSDGVYKAEYFGKTFYFLNTKTAPNLIHDVFATHRYGLISPDVQIREGDVILDLGACEGMFSVMAKKLFPQARVIAFEPVPRTYQTLLENIDLNDCEIEAHNLAVSGKKESLVVNVSKDYSGGSSAVCNYVPSDMFQVIVQAVALDDIFTMFNIERIRFLKIDIEGMEYEVLYASNTLKRVDFLSGEFHYNQRILGKEYDPGRLAMWMGVQTKVLMMELVQMAE